MAKVKKKNYKKKRKKKEKKETEQLCPKVKEERKKGNSNPRLEQ